MAVKLTVKTSGLFFKNPVGQLHRNIYSVLSDAGEFGVSAAREQLQPGHGYLSGALYDSISWSPVKASRGGVRFGGRARIVAGSRGFEPVRRYQGKVERKYRFMANAAKAVRQWADSHRGQISATLARRLS
jgi:hypothetical protein